MPADTMTDTPDPLPPQDGLVALMIAVAIADEATPTAELVQISEIVDNLPIFAGWDAGRLAEMGRVVMDLMAEEDGLDTLFGLIRAGLPERLRETAYALACDVAAADGQVTPQEARMLEETRHELDIDRLHAAAIERGARARYQRL
jgi:tellurite resistance protein